MINDLPSLKAAAFGRCVSRAREEYRRGPSTFATAFPRQKATTPNIGCACKAAPNMDRHQIQSERLGVPQSTRDVSMIVPTLPRGHTARPLLRLDAKRPEFGHPRWSVGAIKT
ncbi:hypothetical protein KRX52_16065 [Pseudomonas sp. MAP12]|uniref:Uncharacterized protein n=1 Tax=Geopseudomonas aromaticivorans TaxID=2849492 RepID=A0ABS6N0G5_9GAMM|nr:hypothetical protein [Pseudomonas aromaticivorans]MBV2134295.1 hypothetical protein [Pseudomonas aromaticivorans]